MNTTIIEDAVIGSNETQVPNDPPLRQRLDSACAKVIEMTMQARCTPHSPDAHEAIMPLCDAVDELTLAALLFIQEADTQMELLIAVTAACREIVEEIPRRCPAVK